MASTNTVADFESNSISPFTIVAYKIRWLFLVFLVLLQALCSFNFAGFGQVSDVYHKYFQVSYAKVDWLTTTAFFTVVVASPILAAFSYFDLTKLKKLIIVASISINISCGLIFSAVTDPSLFACAISGQVFTGIAAAILVAVPPIFGIVWFPTRQFGTAMSLIMLGISSGSILGSLIPANIFLIPKKYGQNATDVQNSWTVKNRRIMMTMFLTLLSVSVLLTILFFSLLPNEPAHYASLAQAKKEENKKLSTTSSKSFLMLLNEVKKLFSLNFVLMTVSMGIIFHVNTVEFTMMAEILKLIKKNNSLPLSSDAAGGYVMSLMAAGGVLGCAVSGIIVDKFQKPHLQAILGGAATCVASVGLVIGYKYQSLIAVGMSNGFYGFFIRISIVPLYKLIIEHSYPIDEIFVSHNLVGVGSLVGTVAAEVGRCIYQRTSGLWVLVFQAVLLLIATIGVLCSKPVFKRQHAEENSCDERCTASEKETLLK